MIFLVGERLVIGMLIIALLGQQMAIDALSLVLPIPVAKLGAQTLCWDIAAAILKFFVTNCSPRDLLSILCEVGYTL